MHQAMMQRILPRSQVRKTVKLSSVSDRLPVEDDGAGGHIAENRQLSNECKIETILSRDFAGRETVEHHLRTGPSNRRLAKVHTQIGMVVWRAAEGGFATLGPDRSVVRDLMLGELPYRAGVTQVSQMPFHRHRDGLVEG